MVCTVLLLVLLLVGLIPGSPTQRPEVEFASSECHVAFQHPGDWIVRPHTTPYAEPCTFFVQPVAWDSLVLEADSVDRYTIRVQVLPESFETVVATSAFERHNGDWVLLGRQGIESPATRIERRGWRGLWGIATLGCYRLEGGYVGLCDSPSAVVGTDRYSIVLEGNPRSDGVFHLILSTLVFRP